MDWQGVWEAIVFGVVQGLTEFLPISSTAHLRVIPALLGWGDKGAGFTAVIQIGTLVAVFFYFRHDISRIAVAFWQALRKGKPMETLDARQAWMMIFATVPILVCGYLFKDHIKGPLRSLYVISGTLIGLGVLLGVAERHLRQRINKGEHLKELEELGWKEALGVGFAQTLALIPGVSRSGVTITAGLFLDLNRETAARFSFLLSLPAILAAGVYELWHDRQELLASSANAVNLLIATVVSGLVGYASIALLLRYLRTRTTLVFIVYRVALGLLLLALLLSGRLQPNEQANSQKPQAELRDSNEHP